MCTLQAYSGHRAGDLAAALGHKCGAAGCKGSLNSLVRQQPDIHCLWSHKAIKGAFAASPSYQSLNNTVSDSESLSQAVPYTHLMAFEICAG